MTAIRWVICAPAGAPWTGAGRVPSAALRSAARTALEAAWPGLGAAATPLCRRGTGWTAAQIEAWRVAAWAQARAAARAAAAAEAAAREAAEAAEAEAAEQEASEDEDGAEAEVEGAAEAQAPEADAPAADATEVGDEVPEASAALGLTPEHAMAEDPGLAGEEARAPEARRAEAAMGEAAGGEDEGVEADALEDPDLTPWMQPIATAPPPRPCAVDAGGPCAACQLFGMRASAPGASAAAPLLTLGDAVPAETDDPETVRLVAEGRLTLDPADRLARALAGAVRLVAFVPGPRRDAGGPRAVLGPFDGFIERAPAVARAALSTQHLKPWARPAGALRLVVTAEAPLAVGVGGAAEGLVATRPSVPGAALRGALAVALAGPQRRFDEALVVGAVHADTGVRFGALVPAPLDAPFLGPWPLTARVCAEDPQHAAIDVTFDRLAWTLADSPGVQAAAESRLKRREVCPTCKAPMVRRSGHRGADEPVATAVHTLGAGRAGPRLAEALPAGTVRVADLWGVTPAALPGLAQLEAAGLSLGAGRSRGWGQVRARLMPAPPRPSVAARAEVFRAALREALRSFGLLSKADHLTASTVTLTLLSPLLPTAETAAFALPGETPWEERFDGSQDLALALAEAGVVVRGRPVLARRFEAVAGRDRAGDTPAERAVSAGAVFVFDVAPGADAALFAALDRLERAGVGRGLHQGFGRVLAFDPAVAAPPAVRWAESPDPETAEPDAADEGETEADAADAGEGEAAGAEQDPTETDEAEVRAMAVDERARPARHGVGEGALVAAAEDALARCFAGAFGALRPTALAFTRLAALAAVASGPAEIASALRAAGATGEAGWSVGLAEAVLAGFEAALPGLEAGSARADGSQRAAAWRRYARYLAQARAHRAVAEATPT